jgi:hypothetical protein
MGLQGWGEGEGPEDVVPGGKEIIGIMTENSSVSAYPTSMGAATGPTVRKAPVCDFAADDDDANGPRSKQKLTSVPQEYIMRVSASLSPLRSFRRTAHSSSSSRPLRTPLRSPKSSVSSSMPSSSRTFSPSLTRSASDRIYLMRETE